MFGREMALVFESYVGEASRVREYLEKDFDGMAPRRPSSASSARSTS